MTSLPWDDDRKPKRAKVLVDDCDADLDEDESEDEDEDDLDPVDKLGKGILDYISPTWKAEIYLSYMHRPMKPCLDDRGSSSFLAFYRRYKSRFDKFMESYSRVGKYPKKDVLPAQTYPTARLDAEYALNRYRNFKRFDTVVVHSNHLFSNLPMDQVSRRHWIVNYNNNNSYNNNNNNHFDDTHMHDMFQITETEAWAVMMRKEWRILEENLPETIFVRAYESRMDLLRAVIVGAKGTPYHNGLFFFDVYFPRAYPVEAPLVRYHSGGLGINPHLFECGEVRLNLCRSPTDKNWTLWPSSNTNMLQFLVSIQEKVLNAHPLHIQPGFGPSEPSMVAAYFSLLYNEAIQLKSYETMPYIMRNPPKLGIFRNYVVDILNATNAYREGLQVGDDMGWEESYKLWFNVDGCMMDLLGGFIHIKAPEVFNFDPIGPIVNRCEPYIHC
ncbi:putative ubiquitin-conjugating enzyme E2, ubiquitin-conjugating enzyme/RWD [Helianthus annuus]|nr:putative ubiquitin-conjugating enzyme E2, ubiquitin-conjugating enzyme/RWD [Helianthus annuus]